MFKERRDLVVSDAQSGQGHRLSAAQGRIYVYPSCAGAIGRLRRRARSCQRRGPSSPNFWETEGVAVVQGSAFGLRPGIPYSYAAKTSDLRSLQTHPAILRQFAIVRSLSSAETALPPISVQGARGGSRQNIHRHRHHG